MPARRGVLIFLLLIGLLGAVVLIAALNLWLPAGGGGGPTVLTFDVPADLEESEPPFAPFSLHGFHRAGLTLFDVESTIREAADDDHVAALVLHLDEIRWGWAKIGEVRDAVQAFREAGKPVYASLEAGAGEPEYMLASAAGVVCAPPSATLALNGLSLTVLYMRGTFDKLGVVPNYEHIGQYKSAVEGYTRTGMSPPAREAMQALLDDHYRLLVDSLASARHLSRGEVGRLLDAGPYTASAGRARGLLDTLLYEAEVDSLALHRAGRHAEALTLERYQDRLPGPHGGRRIALVVAEGTIVPGRSRESPNEGRELGAQTLIESLREARRRKSIKAIVLRVDSPGGSSQASDEIWREVERCRRAKPVIVSMSDYAASGGYYIAVPADSIVASPATLTGSIGVFGGKLNVLGLLHKIGLNVETLSRGAHADMYSPFRDFTPEESRRYRALLEDTYRGFIERVARGRHRPTAYVESIAQGRVWTGMAARPRGLVDALGGLETAFEMARARAGFRKDEEIAVECFPRVRRSIFQTMAEGLFDDDDLSARGVLALPPGLQALIAAARLPAGEVLALMPYSVEVR